MKAEVEARVWIHNLMADIETRPGLMKSRSDAFQAEHALQGEAARRAAHVSRAEEAVRSACEHKVDELKDYVTSLVSELRGSAGAVLWSRW